ncbi:MAG: hypothetical protein M3N51_04605 [Actinomycetota bacterium]|nr:hypothetical protein [Actinomycetota bacterium]
MAQRNRPDRHQPRGSQAASGGLPRFVRDEVARVTEKSRLQPTYELLEAATQAFGEGRYRPALRKLAEAKKLSPRAAVVRELMGLSAYRLRRWEEALRELRTYRRLSGDTTHLPVEMDTLRALGRTEDVHRAWEELQELGGRPGTLKEGRVVYGSFLLDQGEPRRAWEVSRPERITKDPYEEDLRQWYVAARAAAALGDVGTARQLQRGIESQDAGFPGLDALEGEIGAAAGRQ